MITAMAPMAISDSVSGSGTRPTDGPAVATADIAQSSGAMANVALVMKGAFEVELGSGNDLRCELGHLLRTPERKHQQFPKRHIGRRACAADPEFHLRVT